MKTQTIIITGLAFYAGYFLFKKKDEVMPTPQTQLQEALNTGIPLVQINPANVHLITQTTSNPFAGTPGIGGL